MIAKMLAQGTSARAIARMLIEKGVPTARRRKWTAAQVGTIINKINPLAWPAAISKHCRDCSS